MRSALGVGSAFSETAAARVVSTMRDRMFRVIIQFLIFLAPGGGNVLSGARDDDDPGRVRIWPAGHRHADQRDDVGASLRMVLVLSLGSFRLFCYCYR